jgi:hypothetical protein
MVVGILKEVGREERDSEAILLAESFLDSKHWGTKKGGT